MRSHNAVFAGVVTGMPVKDVDANLLLRCISGNLPNCTFGYVKQKFLEAKRSFQVRTCGYALNDLPSWISLQYIVFFVALG
jgi:hypothetical protein